MPDIIGTNVVNSISRRYIVPVIVDTIYTTNALFWRLDQMNKKNIAGGTHVELPFMYRELSNGGPYRGYDPFDVSPNDTVKNGRWDIKQHVVPVTVDGLTLAKCNSPDAIHDLLKLQWTQARMQMASNLGDGIYSDGSNPKDILGLEAAVDDGSVTSSYAELDRASNPWINAQHDSTTATMTLGALRNFTSQCTIGGHTPAMILSRQEQYNRCWNLMIANQRYVDRDDNFTNAGFRNISFDGIPWINDDKVFDGPNANNSAILFLNDDTISLNVFSNTDFYMEEFQRPINQDAMVGKLFWYGELMVMNPQVQGKMTNVSS